MYRTERSCLFFFRRLKHYQFNAQLSRKQWTKQNASNDSHSLCKLGDASTPLPVIISTSGVPIHIYTRELEAQALNQLIVLAQSGIAKGFVAAMADVHVGPFSSFG